MIHSISGLHTPFVLLLSSRLLSVYSSSRSAIVDPTLPRDIKRNKSVKTIFLICMHCVVYILSHSVFKKCTQTVPYLFSKVNTSVVQPSLQLVYAGLVSVTFVTFGNFWQFESCTLLTGTLCLPPVSCLHP